MGKTVIKTEIRKGRSVETKIRLKMNPERSEGGKKDPISE